MISGKFQVVCSLVIILFAVLNVQYTHAEEKYFEGIIEPSELVKVSSPVEGILEEVIFDRGETVEKNQIIAFLKSNIEKAAADLALARVEFSKRKVERNEDLYKKQLLSIHDKDEMETELKIAELQYKEAREKVEIKNIRSPVDGVVVERFSVPGGVCGRGTGNVNCTDRSPVC